MSVDCLEYFGCLDELAQVIYQGFYRFVVLSNVEHDKWTVHLGLSGQEGRWWRGALENADILKVAGSKPSAKVLEVFAERLADAFIQGELSIDNWSPDEGAKIKLTLGPVSNSKTPLHVPLTELSPQEAAAHATKVLFELALQAQSRKCRLGATGPVVSITTEAPPHTNAVSASAIPIPAASSASTTKEQQAQEEVKALKAALANERRRQKSPAESSTVSSSATRPPKGASLANPSKKARKYQALEFESDED